MLHCDRLAWADQRHHLYRYFLYCTKHTLQPVLNVQYRWKAGLHVYLNAQKCQPIGWALCLVSCYRNTQIFACLEGALQYNTNNSAWASAMLKPTLNCHKRKEIMIKYTQLVISQLCENNLAGLRTE